MSASSDAPAYVERAAAQLEPHIERVGEALNGAPSLLVLAVCAFVIVDELTQPGAPALLPEMTAAIDPLTRLVFLYFESERLAATYH